MLANLPEALAAEVFDRLESSTDRMHMMHTCKALHSNAYILASLNPRPTLFADIDVDYKTMKSSIPPGARKHPRRATLAMGLDRSGHNNKRHRMLRQSLIRLLRSPEMREFLHQVEELEIGADVKLELTTANLTTVEHISNAFPRLKHLCIRENHEKFPKSPAVSDISVDWAHVMRGLEALDIDDLCWGRRLLDNVPIAYQEFYMRWARTNAPPSLTFLRAPLQQLLPVSTLTHMTCQTLSVDEVHILRDITKNIPSLRVLQLDSLYLNTGTNRESVIQNDMYQSLRHLMMLPLRGDDDDGRDDDKTVQFRFSEDFRVFVWNTDTGAHRLEEALSHPVVREKASRQIHVLRICVRSPFSKGFYNRQSLTDCARRLLLSQTDIQFD